MGHTHPRPPPPDSQWSPKETGSWGRGEAGLAEADNIWLAIRTLDRPRDQMGVESPLLQNRPVSRKGPGPLPAQETLRLGCQRPPRAGGRLCGRQKSAVVTRPSEGLKSRAGSLRPHLAPPPWSPSPTSSRGPAVSCFLPQCSRAHGCRCLCPL